MKTFFSPFPDLPKAAVRILSNVTFLFVSLSYTAESAIVTAFITFIPKFIESQFGIPASSASIYTGELSYTPHCTRASLLILLISTVVIVIIITALLLSATAQTKGRQAIIFITPRN